MIKACCAPVDWAVFATLFVFFRGNNSKVKQEVRFLFEGCFVVIPRKYLLFQSEEEKKKQPVKHSVQRVFCFLLFVCSNF